MKVGSMVVNKGGKWPDSDEKGRRGVGRPRREVDKWVQVRDRATGRWCFER